MIRFLTESDAQNLDLVKVLVFNINQNYAQTEAEFWNDGVERTTVDEFQKEIQNKHVLAFFEDQEIIGSVNFKIQNDEAKFSMLSVNLNAHGKGIGNKLYHTMEDYLVSKSVNKLFLDLLIPRHYKSDYKDFVFNWYLKKGFVAGEIQRTEGLDFFPYQDLKIESDFIQMRKDL